MTTQPGRRALLRPAESPKGQDSAENYSKEVVLEIIVSASVFKV